MGEALVADPAPVIEALLAELPGRASSADYVESPAPKTAEKALHPEQVFAAQVHLPPPRRVRRRRFDDVPGAGGLRFAQRREDLLGVQRLFGRFRCRALDVVRARG